MGLTAVPWRRVVGRIALSVFVALFACDLNDDGNRQGNELPQATHGVLTPRFQAASGVLSDVDSVRLRLRIVDGAEPNVAVVALDLPWSAKSATLSRVPLRRKWLLEVYGTKGTDTLWYGTDTGTISSAGTVSHDLSSPSVVVKNFVPRPTILWNGNSLQNGATVLIGDTIVVQAPDSAHLGVAADGLKPGCFPVGSGTSHLVMRSEGSYNLSVMACDEGRWDSRVVEVGWIARLRDSISLLTRLDSVFGTWRSWTSPVRMATSNELGVAWRAMASSDTGAPGSADWVALDGLTGGDRVGFYVDSNAVRSLVEASMGSDDSVGKILVKARAMRGNVAVDSMRFWWKIHLPTIRRPVVTNERGFGYVRFSWVTATGRDIRTWIGIDGKWTQVQPTSNGATSYSQASGVAPGTLVKFRLVAIDPSSGRASDTAWDSAISRNPPPIPKFDVVNTRTDSAYVTLTLGAYSESLDGVEWGVAYGRAYSGSMSFTKVADLATKPWTQQVGEGVFVFVVRAIRDDSTTVDTQWCEAKGLAANRPQMPQNLRLVRRTTDSLYWEWAANPDRSYAVYWGSDRAQTISTQNSVVLASGSGNFSRKIEPGDSSWIAVFAQPGGDSTGGESVGAYSSLARTRSIPGPVKGFQVAIEYDANWNTAITANWTANPGLRYVVRDSTGFVDTTEIGQESLRWMSGDTSRTRSIVSIRALNLDSVLSEPVLDTVRIPRIRGIDTTSWATWIGDRTVTLRLGASVAELPDSIRIVVPWTLDGSRLDTTMPFPELGSQRSFEYDSARLRAQPTMDLQYIWANGDRSRSSVLALEYLPPSFGMTFDVGSGVDGDTVVVATSGLPSGWSLEYSIHSVSGGWKPRSLDGRYGSGVDSIRWRLVRSQNVGPSDTTIFAVAKLDHRKRMDVVYRDGTSAKIWTTRIAGRTWMAENLAYDIPGDTLDGCFASDPAKCATDGRRYSVSQIFALSGGGICDTIEWSSAPPGTCDPKATSICPVGWKLPSSSDFELLGTVAGNSGAPWFRSGGWPGFSAPLDDPFGMDVTWPGWCFRQGVFHGCHDSTLGTAFPLSDESLPGTISGAYFDVGDAMPIWSAMVWYFNPEDVPRAPSYFPVRCVKE